MQLRGGVQVLNRSKKEKDIRILTYKRNMDKRFYSLLQIHEVSDNSKQQINYNSMFLLKVSNYSPKSVVNPPLEILLYSEKYMPI